MAKKNLAFLGENVTIKYPLIKDSELDSKEIDIVMGQVVGLGEEGELIISSEHGLINIVGGSLTKV